MPSANDLMDEAAALLNDPTQKMFTDVILLPYLKRAYKDLLLKMHVNQIQTLDEISDVQTVNTMGLTFPNQPADLIQPVRMSERASGSNDVFTPMFEKQWEPDIQPTGSLRYWVWREQVINFIGATEPRQVKLYYLKNLSPIVDASSVININYSDNFLASKTAYYAAAFSAENPVKADVLRADADDALEDFLTMEANRRQSIPVRRIPATRSINRGRILK